MEFSNHEDESMEQSALDLLSLAASHHHEQTPFVESAGGRQVGDDEDDGDRTEEEDLSLQLDLQLLPPLPLPEALPIAIPAPIPLDEPSSAVLPPLPTPVLTSLPPLPATPLSPLLIPTNPPTTSTSSATPVIPHLVPEDSGIIRCVCPYTEDDGFTIQCDTCNVWQHANCVEINQEDVPEEYLCELCDADGARKRGVDRIKAELMQRKRIEAEALRGVGAVDMGRSMSIGLSARGGFGRGGGRGGMAGSRKNSNNTGNQQDDSGGTGFHASTSNNHPGGSNDVNMMGTDEHQSPVVKVDRRRRGNKHHLPTASATSRSRPSASTPRQPSTSSQAATTSQPLQATTPAASSYSNDPSHQYFPHQNTHPHNSEDEGNELGAWGLGAGLGSDERYETWQYEYTPVEKNLWRDSKVVDRFRWLLEQDDASEFPKPEANDAPATLQGPTGSTPGRQRAAIHNAAMHSQVTQILDVVPFSLPSLPEPSPFVVKPVPSPSSFLLLPPSASTFSSSSSQAPQCSYPAPTTYHVLSTNGIPPNTFIGSLKGRITDLEAYRRDPVNQYDLLGLPKSHVRAVARPWSVAVDMRLWGCELRFARSGCHPNAAIKVVRVKKGAAEEEKGKAGDEMAVGDQEVEAAEDLAGNLWAEQKAGNEVGLDELTFAVYSLREIGKKEEIVLPWDWDDQHLIHLLPHLMSLSPNSPDSPLPFALEGLSKKFSQVANTLLGVYQQCACSGSNENKKNCCLFWLNKGSNVLKTAFVNNYTKREPFSVLFLNALGAGTQGGDGRKKGQRGGKKIDLGALIGLARDWLEARPREAVVQPEREIVKEEEEVEEGDQDNMQVDEPAETIAHDLKRPEAAVLDLNDDSDDSDLTEPLSHPSDSEHNSSEAESEEEIVRPPIVRRRLLSGSRIPIDVEAARKKVRKEESAENVFSRTTEGDMRRMVKKKQIMSTRKDVDLEDEDDTQGEKNDDEAGPPVASTSTTINFQKAKPLLTAVAPGLQKEKSSVIVGRKKKPIKVIKRKTFEKRPPGPESTPLSANRGKVANVKSSITSSINKLKIRKDEDKSRELERDKSSTPASTRTNSPAPTSLPPQTQSIDSIASASEENFTTERRAQRDVEMQVVDKVDQPQKKDADVTMTDSTSAELPTTTMATPPRAPVKEPTPPPPEPPKPPVRARLSLAAYRQRQAQQPAEPAPSPATIEPAPPLVDTPQPMEEPAPQPAQTPALSVQASLTVAGSGSRPSSSSGPTSAFSTVSTEDMLKRLGDYFSSTATPAPPLPPAQRTFQQQAEGSNSFSSARPGPVIPSQQSAYRRSPSPPSPPPSSYRERAREPSPVGYTAIPKRFDVFRRPPSPPPQTSQQPGGLELDAEVPSSREYRRSSGSRWDAPAPKPVSPQLGHRRLSVHSPPPEERRSPPSSQGASLFSIANQRPSPPVRALDGPPLDAPTGPRGVPPSPPSQRGGYGRSLPFGSNRLSPDLGSPSFSTTSLPANSDLSSRAPGPIPSGPRGFSGSSNSGAPATPTATGRPSWPPPRGGGPPFRGRGGRGTFSSTATTPGPSSRPPYDGIPTGPRTNTGPFRGRGGAPIPGWNSRGRGRGRGGP